MNGSYVAVRRTRSSARIAGALLALITLTLGLLVGGQRAAAATSTTDLVFVHGFGACQDARGSGMGPLLTQYYWRNAPMSTLHAVEYYGCDTDGESIVEYGPDAAGYYPSPDDNSYGTDIRHFSYELAWWLWDTFSSRGKPVDLVGHSMGGLIVAFALQRVAARDPLFPPYLTVPSVITVAAPFKGVPGATCPASNKQCNEMLPGSVFTSSLMTAGAMQPGKDTAAKTMWTLIGSVGCDLVVASSTLALPRANWAVDYSKPCYTHTNYLSDYSTAADAWVTINGRAYTGKAHALALISSLLM